VRDFFGPNNILVMSRKRARTPNLKAQLEEIAEEFGVVILTHRVSNPRPDEAIMCYKAYKRKLDGSYSRTPCAVVPATQQGINQMLSTLNRLGL
jgi:hypothetical protein